MLKTINCDLFDIASRIREIDPDYFIIYNTGKERYEIHNKAQKDTYCLTIPYKELDARTIDLVNKTKIENAKKIYKEMELQNEKLKKNNYEKIFQQAMFKSGL